MLMKKSSQHASHPQVTKRLKRASGHLLSVINMIEERRSCVDIAQQLFAVEKAVSAAKRVLIQDHIDHCLDSALADHKQTADIDTSEFKAIVKYL